MNSILNSAYFMGALFYYGPYAPESELLITTMFNGELSKTLPELPLDIWQDAYQHPDLKAAWQAMFLGTDTFDAPPWGSVYLDKENVIFGVSLADLRRFMIDESIVFDKEGNEPEDHIGILFLLLTNFIQHENESAAKVLLAEHILPWSGRYLTCLKQYSRHPFITLLADYTKSQLDQWQHHYQIEITPKELYWPPQKLES